MRWLHHTTLFSRLFLDNQPFRKLVDVAGMSPEVAGLNIHRCLLKPNFKTAISFSSMTLNCPPPFFTEHSWSVFHWESKLETSHFVSSKKSFLEVIVALSPIRQFFSFFHLLPTAKLLTLYMGLFPLYTYKTNMMYKSLKEYYYLQEKMDTCQNYIYSLWGLLALVQGLLWTYHQR